MEIIKQYEKTYKNLDKKIVEVIRIPNECYPHSIKFVFAYFEYNESTDAYEEWLKIDNSEGQAHMHLNGRKVEIDFNDWKIALLKFDQLVDERRRIRFGGILNR